jgi:L-cystine uptake protein TcyP (sodium:dicarboxylate symporter family)
MIRKFIGILLLAFFPLMWIGDMLLIYLFRHGVSPLESFRETWWTWRFTFWDDGKKR